jgi:hypothetical protein
MAPAQGPPRRDARPRAKTPAERAEAAANVQRLLKQEAAERRHAAARTVKPPSAHARAAGRRRTP